MNYFIQQEPIFKIRCLWTAYLTCCLYFFMLNFRYTCGDTAWGHCCKCSVWVMCSLMTIMAMRTPSWVRVGWANVRWSTAHTNALLACQLSTWAGPSLPSHTRFHLSLWEYMWGSTCCSRVGIVFRMLTCQFRVSASPLRFMSHNLQ